jgi:simple sugar transport system permease protein
VRDWVRNRPEGGIAVMFVVVQVVCIAAALMYPESFRYLSEANIAVTLKAIAPLGIIALGVGVLMIAGEFDLSVGALFSFCAIVCATLSNNVFGGEASAIAPFLGMIVALAIGTAAGIANALITLRFAIPSFITTLGAMLLWKGATLLYHGASSLRFKPSEPFASLFAGSIGVLHASIIWFAIFAVLFYFLLHHHKLGNHFYAVGGNRNARRQSASTPPGPRSSPSR